MIVIVIVIYLFNFIYTRVKTSGLNIVFGVLMMNNIADSHI